MKFQASAATAAMALFSGLSVAQNTNVSKPFNLVVLSNNATYNGTALEPCHEGAGIEALCLTARTPKQVYHLNTTQNYQSGVPGDSVPGTLTYLEPAQPQNVSEGLSFSYNPASNVVLPLFEPAYNPTVVAFDKNQLMNIQAYLDDTKNPPSDSSPVALYRWYVCRSNFEGYVYEALNWVAGKYPPENPTCVKANVTRVFTA